MIVGTRPVEALSYTWILRVPGLILALACLPAHQEDLSPQVYLDLVVMHQLVQLIRLLQDTTHPMLNLQLLRRHLLQLQ